MKVLNYGSLNYDYVYSVDHMVVAGETLSSGDMATFCGGKGMNQSIALAKAGVPVYHAGMVGEEGRMLLDECEKNGVNTEFIKTIPGKSGHTIIQVDKNGQNCILLFGGANRAQTKEHMDEVLSHFEAGDMLLLQNEVNDVDYLIEQAYAKGMQIALNPSPFDEKLDKCDMTKISLFFINEIEGAQITGEKEPEAILDKCREIYPHAKAVLTMGGDGCIYQDGEKRVSQPIFKVEVVDTTAAGDTFTGYFISSMLEELPVETGLKRAAKASSIAVSRAGATASIPLKEEVQI
ncbi:MAG: ribokinase [Lachnospiraceae bacterium]|nr:ribokinase [Lachnospiraceae bacterium]